MKRFLSPRVVLVALVLAVFSAVVVTAQRTPTAAGAMSTAATRFLDALTPDQRKQATYPLESDEYLHWNFIPDETFPRNGLPLKAMTEPQRKLAHELLKSGLSDRGYQTYTSIIAAREHPARRRGRRARWTRPGDGARRQRISLLRCSGSRPRPAVWGWRVEGHHISLHFLVNKGTVVASTPSFAGSNPAEVQDGADKGQARAGACSRIPGARS